MKISGAIFDLDGTLTDSMFVWRVVGARYLKSCGVTPNEDPWLLVKDMSTKQVIEYFKTEYGIVKSDGEIRDGINFLAEKMYMEEVFPKKGVIELLDAFHKRGIKMCVASATDEYLVDAVLRKNGMRNYFSEIFSCHTVRTSKDTPVIYETALAHLSTPKSETLVFEDSLYALRSAKNAGFTVVGVYDSAETNCEDMRALSDFYITDYSIDKDLFCV